jgi:hypothetical protein
MTRVTPEADRSFTARSTRGRTASSASELAPAIPHSWSIAQWPGTIYPGDSGKAKYLIRVRKLELIEAGALVRVGRELVILGQPFARWLMKKATRVPGFEIAANRRHGRQGADRGAP